MLSIDGNMQKTIAVDFDDTICDSLFPDCGEPKKGVKEALQKFRELGFLILIHTCRTCHWHYNIFGGSRDIPTMERPAVVNMKEWLYKHQIPFDDIDDGSKGKPLADYYCDDKAIRFENNWDEIVKFVELRESKQ